MLACKKLEEKSGHHQSQEDSSSGEHEHELLCKISWKYIQSLLRYFSLDGDSRGTAMVERMHPLGGTNMFLNLNTAREEKLFLA